MGYSPNDVIAVGKYYVGYLEKRSDSQLDNFSANVGYNNYNIFAKYFDEQWTDFYNNKKQAQPYCDIFHDFCHVVASLKNGGTVDDAREALCQPKKSAGAGCYYSAQYYRSAGRLDKTPRVGDQIFFLDSFNEEYHTGIVYAVDSTTVYTIEANTSTSGASGIVDNGGGVALRSYNRSKYSSKMEFGHPKYTASNSEKQGSDSMKEFGIDISAWQGSFDIAKAVKNEGVKFVVLKAGGADDGYYKDSQFESNYSKAKSAGIHVGAYFFSKALNTSMAKQEAKFFYENCLQGKQFDLPVYLDVENKTQIGIGKATLTSVIKTWCEAMKSYGFLPGIYSSLSYFSSYMNDSELSGYEHWVAQWSTSCQYSGCGMWQFGGETNYIRSNKINGQTVDQDYLLKDYPTYIKSNGLNGYPSKQYTEGWVKDTNGWWYRYKDGSYPKNTWKKINSKWYYFDGEGYCLVSKWKEFNGDYYYLGSDGAMVTNKTLKIDENGKLVYAGNYYHLLKEVTYNVYREALDAAIAKQFIKGEGGTGDNMIINLPEESVRMIVYLHRAGLF